MGWDKCSRLYCFSSTLLSYPIIRFREDLGSDIYPQFGQFLSCSWQVLERAAIRFKGLRHPYDTPQSKIKAYPVGKAVNSPRNHSEDLPKRD
jgi:hypothetical protein